MKFTAVVPLKANSQRIPGKNFKLLAGKPLFVHIFDALLQAPEIGEVVCWASDEVFKKELPDGVKFIKRESYLDADTIKAKDIITGIVNQIDSDFYILAHATSPFLTANSISKGIKAIADGYDSSLSVQEIKNYCWFKDKTLNYDINNPIQTQYLDSVYCETSGFFIFSKSLVLSKGRRIGDNPKMIPVSDLEAIDIDEDSDYEFAKLLESALFTKESK